MRARRAGFTLMELLIAAAIGGVVLALTIRGFSEIQKVMAASRSKLDSQRQAADGVAKVADLFKKAHVFYYSARPLKAQAAPVTGRPDDPADRDDLPATLRTAAGTGNTWRPPDDRNTQINFAAWRAAQAARVNFRFTETAPDGDPALRLVVAPGRRTADEYESRFRGPIAYFATADFVPTGSGDESNPRSLLPRSWTFNLLYLAPMKLEPNDPNIAEAGNPRDNLPGPVPVNISPARTAVPYELRMLTIPGVVAGATSAPAYTVTPAVTTGLGSHAVEFDANVGRILAPGATPASPAFLDPPYDYDGGPGGARANYDPIPLPMNAAPAVLLDPGAGLDRNLYRFRGPGGALLGRFPSGPRIDGGGLHANFNHLGNDPPTDAALVNRLPGSPPISDRAIVSYVDPDDAEGNMFRFVNNMKAPPGAADANGDVVIPATNRPYRRFVDMIGPGCSYLENRYHADWADTASPTATGSYGVEPERAVVGVSIRYRARKDIPFSFASVRTEVALDGRASYAKIRPRR